MREAKSPLSYGSQTQNRILWLDWQRLLRRVAGSARCLCREHGQPGQTGAASAVYRAGVCAAGCRPFPGHPHENELSITDIDSWQAGSVSTLTRRSRILSRYVYPHQRSSIE